jgi:hypothetical protein
VKGLHAKTQIIPTCFAGHYIYALLTHGFGFNNKTWKISFKDTVSIIVVGTFHVYGNACIYFICSHHIEQFFSNDASQKQNSPRNLLYYVVLLGGQEISWLGVWLHD